MSARTLGSRLRTLEGRSRFPSGMEIPDCVVTQDEWDATLAAHIANPDLRVEGGL